MRKQIVLLAMSLLFICQAECLAWGNKKTHPALTAKAVEVSDVVDNYLKNQLDISDGLQTQLTWNFPADVKERLRRGEAEPDLVTRTLSEWIKAGSVIEDEDGDKWPQRPRHHFHDPTRNAGLDNQHDHPDWNNYACTWTGFDLTGESTVHWATIGTAEKKPTTNNHYWGKAREEFYKAFTESDESVREEFIAKTFLNIGHVLHLIEDMGVPAHTRNDFIEAHYRGIKSPLNFKDNPLERHVENEVEGAGTIPAKWLVGWSPQAKVYSKLAYYWDTNSYTGQPAGTSSPSNWGLSEQTNYQFLSQSTIFRANDGSLYYFPQPNVNNVTGYIEPGVYLKDSAPVNYGYISGYDVTHLARTKFIEKYAYIAGMQYPVLTETVVYHTTFDKAVYEDYAAITLPRTIDYVTGLANYFFRGRLSVEPNWADPNIVELTITNDSNNSGVPQVLAGGVFELYWDGTDGNRAEVNDFAVSGWGTESVLDYNDTVTATFTKEVNAACYTLVYEGQICENPSEPDPCDPNAIAVAIFRPGYQIIAWGLDDHNQVSDVPDGNEFVAVAAGKWHCIALKSDGSLAGWGYNKYGQCDVPDGNDYTAISAGDLHSIALKSDGAIVVWGRDNAYQITDKPDGNDFVAVTAGMLHSLAIKKDGTIVGWGGYNSYGECDAPPPDAGTVYIDIAAGAYHSLALQSDGVVKAWGNNNFGQTRIYDGAAGKVHEAVAAGGNYSFLLRDDDVLISWGGGDWLYGSMPRYHYRYADGNDITVIAAGLDHIMALTSDGKAFDWDWPYGDFPFDYFDRTVPADVVFTEDIDGGYDFSAALRLP
ncbi:MAG: hypothetical protein PHY02_09085 [Phycisphaerae bacterium]|nr:hypothetical protein [Phycisphaerae bacterium]